MGASHSSSVETAEKRVQAALQLETLITENLLNFDSKLQDFTELNFGLSTPRGLAAAEPLYYESALTLLKDFLVQAGPLLSEDQKQVALEGVLARLLLEQRVGAVTALVNDKELRISKETLERLTPLSELCAKNTLRHGNVMFLGQAAYVICPAFMKSAEYEELLAQRIFATLAERPLGALVDLVDAVPLPKRVMLVTRPAVERAVLEHLRSRNLPEEIATLIKPFELRAFLGSTEFKSTLQDSCCAALNDGDLKLIPEIAQAFVAPQYLAFEDVLTPRVRDAAGFALDQAQAECDYFAFISETEESGPATTKKLAQEMRQLSRLLEVTRPLVLAPS